MGQFLSSQDREQRYQWTTANSKERDDFLYGSFVDCDGDDAPSTVVAAQLAYSGAHGISTGYRFDRIAVTEDNIGNESQWLFIVNHLATPYTARWFMFRARTQDFPVARLGEIIANPNFEDETLEELNMLLGRPMESMDDLLDGLKVKADATGSFSPVGMRTLSTLVMEALDPLFRQLTYLKDDRVFLNYTDLCDFRPVRNFANALYDNNAIDGRMADEFIQSLRRMEVTAGLAPPGWLDLWTLYYKSGSPALDAITLPPEIKAALCTDKKPPFDEVLESMEQPVLIKGALVRMAPENPIMCIPWAEAVAFALDKGPLADWVPRDRAVPIDREGHGGKAGDKRFWHLTRSNGSTMYIDDESFRLLAQEYRPFWAAEKIKENQRMGNVFSSMGISETHGGLPGYNVWSLRSIDLDELQSKKSTKRKRDEPQERRRAPRQRRQADPGWECSQCDFVNEPGSMHCQLCDSFPLSTGPRTPTFTHEEESGEFEDEFTGQPLRIVTPLSEFTETTLQPRREVLRLSEGIADISSSEDDDFAFPAVPSSEVMSEDDDLPFPAVPSSEVISEFSSSEDDDFAFPGLRPTEGISEFLSSEDDTILQEFAETTLTAEGITTPDSLSLLFTPESLRFSPMDSED